MSTVPMIFPNATSTIASSRIISSGHSVMSISCTTQSLSLMVLLMDSASPENMLDSMEPTMQSSTSTSRARSLNHSLKRSHSLSTRNSSLQTSRRPSLKSDPISESVTESHKKALSSSSHLEMRQKKLSFASTAFAGVFANSYSSTLLQLHSHRKLQRSTTIPLLSVYKEEVKLNHM